MCVYSRSAGVRFSVFQKWGLAGRTRRMYYIDDDVFMRRLYSIDYFCVTGNVTKFYLESRKLKVEAKNKIDVSLLLVWSS